MKSTYKYIFAIFSVAALFSCDEEMKPAIQAPATSRLLVAHFSPTIDPTRNLELFTGDVKFGNNNRKINVAFSASGVTNPSSGNVLLKTRLGSLEETFISGTFNAEKYTHYTALLANTDPTSTAADAPAGLAILKDDLSVPETGNAKVRVIHLGVGAPAVDVYMFIGNTITPAVAQGVSYSQSFPGNVTLPLAAGAISAPIDAGFTSLPAGNYNFQLRAAGSDPTSTAVLSNTASLAAGRTYTIVVRGFLSPPQGSTGRALGTQIITHERTVY